MDPRVFQRFIVISAVVAAVVISIRLGYWYFTPPPGDVEAHKGDTLLDAAKNRQALVWFDRALRAEPTHHAARLGRAVALIRLRRYPEAMTELGNVIDELPKTLDAEDPEDKAVLATAYANRGIIHDRNGEYLEALGDYVRSLEIAADTVAEPNLLEKILYDPRPSTVRDRARHIFEQLQKPENDRVLRALEFDATQKLYRPSPD